MKGIRYIAAVWVLLLSGHLCLSQCHDIVWPSDAGLAERARFEIDQLHLARKSKDYRKATAALTWLARNAPRADTNLYVQADLVYSELLSREHSSTVKKLYLDSIYRFYDLRARHCDKFLDVNEARAMALYRHFISVDPKMVREQLDSIVRHEGTDASNQVLVAYMESVKTEFRKYEKLKEKDILIFYNTAIKVAEKKRSQVRKAKLPEEPVMRLMDDIDAILFSMIVVDCPFVKKILGPRFREYPDDLMLARKVISLMLQNQCVDDPLWMLAAERIYIGQDEPDYSLAKSIGLRYFSAKNFTQARYYLAEAARLAPTGVDRSAMLVLVGQIEARTDKSKARSTFRSALEADKENKEGYERIGDLYFDSEDSCGGPEEITPLLVYMLAAEYYQHAGNGQKISMAREKFPTKAALKQWGYAEGQKVNVECWIQETTTIRAKN